MPGAETRQDRTPEEVAGYPPFNLGHDSRPMSTGANGVTTEYGRGSRTAGTPTRAPTRRPRCSARRCPSRPRTTGGYPPLGASRPPEADQSVDAPTERLPIYEAVLSQWFEAADTGSIRDERAVRTAAGGRGERGQRVHPRSAARPRRRTDVGQQPPVADRAHVRVDLTG